MGRKKHTKTDFEKYRTKYRELCDRHVVTFEVDMDETMKRHAFAYADKLRVLGNECIAILNRRLDQLFRTKSYRKLQKDYGWHAVNSQSYRRTVHWQQGLRLRPTDRSHQL